jgi:probable phosphoglycerate mutase
VRHGQSTWNAEGRIQGQAPGVPLTSAGRRQALLAARSLRDSGATQVFTSDLTRAVQTAEPIARLLGVRYQLDPALREQALGSLEGRLGSDLAESAVPPGVAVTSVRWGGGESIADVHARVSGFLARTLLAGQAHDLVLVTHADLIRVAVACLRGRGPDDIDWFEVPNGSVTTVFWAGGQLRSVATTAPDDISAGSSDAPGVRVRRSAG